MRLHVPVSVQFAVRCAVFHYSFVLLAHSAVMLYNILDFPNSSVDIFDGIVQVECGPHCGSRNGEHTNLDFFAELMSLVRINLRNEFEFMNKILYDENY